MERKIERAEVLVEALPYIQRFAGRVVVIKYGGSAMVKEELRQSFALDVLLLQLVGIRPVVVHGGGPQIDVWLEKLRIPVERVGGLRVTSPEVMGVVEMVLGGQVNRGIVQLIQNVGGHAVGLTGKDGGLIRARRIAPKDGPDGPQDLGQVGEVVSVDPDVIATLDDEGYVPVIAPVAPGEGGESLNVNADTLAGEIARALGAEKFILLTDVPGVLDPDGELLSALSPEQARALIDDGTASGGMIPKIECCLHALEGGVASAHVIDGRVKHAVLLEIFTDDGVGTQIGGDTIGGAPLAGPTGPVRPAGPTP